MIHWLNLGKFIFILQFIFDYFEGLPQREVGDLGPVYGFQWRHFGAEYETMRTDYTGRGVDQLKNVIHTIKTNPCCRRIIMSAWNPVGKKKISLFMAMSVVPYTSVNVFDSCNMQLTDCNLASVTKHSS